MDFINNIKDRFDNRPTLDARPLRFSERTDAAMMAIGTYLKHMEVAGVSDDYDKAKPAARVAMRITAKLKGQLSTAEARYSDYLLAESSIIRSLAFVRAHRALDEVDRLAAALRASLMYDEQA